MNIVLHSSDLFSAVLAVSMVSILENNKEEQNLNFFVIEHEISESQLLLWQIQLKAKV